MSKLDEIQKTLRQAEATADRYDGEDSWLSAYRRDVPDLLAVVDAAEKADREIRAYLHAYVVSELTVEQLCSHVLDSVTVLRSDLSRVTEGGQT